MKTLNGLKILITRPAHQTDRLATTIQACGGIAYCFPTLKISANTHTKLFIQSIQQLANYDRVIFISPNAVFKTAHHIHKLYTNWPSKTKVIAMGPGTVAALKQYNLPIDAHPEKTFSSESLLELSLLQNLAQKKILIIKGKGGRLHLVKKLRGLGADVSTVSVYLRQLPSPDKNSIPKKKASDIILCTSHTGIKNLVTLLYPTWQEILFESQLLVISPRIAHYAKKLGFVKPPLISDNVSDDAILQTLFSWREQPSWNHSQLNLSKQ